MHALQVKRGESTRFRSDANHSIPLPNNDLGAKRAKRYDQIFTGLPIAIGTPAVILAVGIALEIGAQVSRARGGFQVPQQNIFGTLISPQFLTSFLPTLFVLPLAFMWRELDRIMRWYQPYVVLWSGDASAEESVLLDYIASGPLWIIYKTLKFKHYTLLISTLIGITTYIFQPLAASVFQIQQLPQTEPTSVIGLKTLGLASNVNDLSGFAAAAGYAEAAVSQGLSDPPFVQGDWSTAEFTFPVMSRLNGTIMVNTTGIQTTVNCVNPANMALQNNTNGTLSLTSTSVEQCVHTVVFDPKAASAQYGVDDIPCPGNASSTDVTFRPVMFWYFHQKSDNTSQAQTIFCTPSIQLYDVQASAILNNGSLIDVVALSNNPTTNSLNTQTYNGLIFPSNNNTFIQARAAAVRSGVPGAIFQFASQQPNGPQSTFDLPSGFRDITDMVYTQHLSTAAKSTYYTSSNNTLPAMMTSLGPVLIVDPLASHLLAAMLIFTGCAGIIIQLLHRPHRRKLLLASPPGTIAAVVSLTARSGFGELLLPYDNEETIRQKLKGVHFGLDRETGAILADDDRALGGFDDTSRPLWGNEQQEYKAIESRSLS